MLHCINNNLREEFIQDVTTRNGSKDKNYSRIRFLRNENQVGSRPKEGNSRVRVEIYESLKDVWPK